MKEKEDLKPGDTVKVSKLNREGIVMEILSNNSVRIALGNLPLVVSIHEVTKIPSQPSSTKKKAKKSSMQSFSVESSSSQGTESEEIDLHGFTVEEGLIALEDKINRAILSRVYRLRIVHGLGSGRLKEAIHNFLSSTSYVSSFKLDDFNPGVTWVYL